MSTAAGRPEVERELTGARRLVFLAATAAALLLFDQLRTTSFLWEGTHLLRTSFFQNDSGVFGGLFRLQLGAMFLGVAALQWAPSRWVRPLLMVEGLVCLGGYDWPTAGVYLAAALSFYGALELPLPRAIRWAVPIAWLAGAGLLGHWFDETYFYRDGHVFGALYGVRFLVYAWEKWQRGYPKGSLGDYLFYVLSPPLITFPPYLVIIPFYGEHGRNLHPRMTARRALVAFKHVGLAAALALLASPPILAWVRSTHPDQHWWGRPEGFAQGVAAVGASAHAAYALLLLHGIAERPPLRWPLLSTSYLELWQRYQIHQKDLQVAFFYNPLLMRLRRRNRYLAITAAVAVTMLIGNPIIHVLARYLYDWPAIPARLLHITYFNAASTVLLAGGLCLQEWRKRNRRSPPEGILAVVWGIAGWALTMACVSFLT